jgi:hypothetical protein
MREAVITAVAVTIRVVEPDHGDADSMMNMPLPGL